MNATFYEIIIALYIDRQEPISSTLPPATLQRAEAETSLLLLVQLGSKREILDRGSTGSASRRTRSWRCDFLLAFRLGIGLSNVTGERIRQELD